MKLTLNQVIECLKRCGDPQGSCEGCLMEYGDDMELWRAAAFYLESFLSDPEGKNTPTQMADERGDDPPADL